MKRINLFLMALAAVGLAGCVGYGYPGSDGGYSSQGGYSSANTGYPPPGYGHPGNGYPGSGSHGEVMRCDSNDGRTRHCAANTRGGVRMVRQLSKAACIQGRSWGYDNSGIWVAQGCRAEFVVGRGGRRGGQYGPDVGANPGYGQSLRCESIKGRQQRCNVRVNRGVQVVRQLSKTRCVQGQNWGWDRGGVWVTGGCRAEFIVR